MKNVIRPLLWIVLLGGGFIAGVAWRNSDTQPASDQSEPTNVDAPLNVSNVDNASEAKSEPLSANPRLLASETHTIQLFEESAPSVCFITTTNVRRDYWSRNITEIPRGTGSGFIWDANGHIITNYHVIQGADRAQVTLGDQSTWDAELVGVAPDKDLAVLRIDAPRAKLRPIPVGSSNNLMVGQAVYAIGNPFGLDQTLTTGIVSALGREIKSVSGIPIREVIQTDAAINPGNSGGPLLDSSGRLIGVNTAIYSPSGASAGIGFSIPVNIVRWVIPELIEHGRIKRPSLGITVTQTSVIQRYELDGPLIREVEPNSAAAKAGLRPTIRDSRGEIQLGDIILRMDKQKIETYEDLILALEKYQPGDEVTLLVKRGDRQVEVLLTLDPAQG
jgi:S1-C subfamily serine protease